MQKTLFDLHPSEPLPNLLPKEGYVYYSPALFDAPESLELFSALTSSLQWQADELWMFGQKIVTRRKVAWIGDAGCSYTYSGVEKHPQAWTPELLLIKNKLEAFSQASFNSCLLNLYHDGSDGMGWHSDDEKELDSQSPIASLSLGSTRKFAFRHKKDKTTTSLFLESGSLLMMLAPTQEFWLHSLLKTKTIAAPRINLTFRTIRTRSKTQ
jgi:alkylated DNA repair dioxygenase AlkB